MKKLYQGKGRRVHPAPAAGAALPVAVLALASALTAEEQEVLAYLLSCGGAAARPRRRGAHPPEMGCGCFGCYKSFWARWDASPNRNLIHRIIDAVEEGGGNGGPPSRPSRGRRRRGRRGGPRRRGPPPRRRQLPPRRVRGRRRRGGGRGGKQQQHGRRRGRRVGGH